MSWTTTRRVCRWDGLGWRFVLPHWNQCDEEIESLLMATLSSESNSTVTKITHIECRLYGWQSKDEVAKLLISFLRSNRYIKNVTILVEDLKGQESDFEDMNIRLRDLAYPKNQIDNHFDSKLFEESFDFELLAACLQAASENTMIPLSGVKVMAGPPNVEGRFYYKIVEDAVNRYGYSFQAMRGTLLLDSNFPSSYDDLGPLHLGNMGGISNFVCMASLQWLQELTFHYPSPEFQNSLFGCMEQMKMPLLRKLSIAFRCEDKYPQRGHTFGTFLSSDACHLESLILDIIFPWYGEDFISWIEGLESGNSIKKLDVKFDLNSGCFDDDNINDIPVFGQLIHNLLSDKVEEFKLKITFDECGPAPPVYLAHLQSTIWPELQRVRPSLKSLELCDFLFDVDIGAENLKSFLELTKSLTHLKLDIEFGDEDHRLPEVENMMGRIFQTIAKGFLLNNTLTSLDLPCRFFDIGASDDYSGFNEFEYIDVLLQGSIRSSEEKKSTVTILGLTGFYSKLPQMLRANTCSLVDLKVYCHYIGHAVELVSVARDCRTLQKLFVIAEWWENFNSPREDFWADIADYLPQLHLDSLTVDGEANAPPLIKYERVSSRLIRGMERNCMLREASFRFGPWTVEKKSLFVATIDNLCFRNNVSKFCQQLLADFDVKVNNKNSIKALMKLVFPLLRSIENKRNTLDMTTHNSIVVPGALMENVWYSTVVFAAFRGYQFLKFARENMAAKSIQRTWKMYVASSKESV